MSVTIDEVSALATESRGGVPENDSRPVHTSLSRY